jgi:hypothetical protein
VKTLWIAGTKGSQYQPAFLTERLNPLDRKDLIQVLEMAEDKALYLAEYVDIAEKLV